MSYAFWPTILCRSYFKPYFLSCFYVISLFYLATLFPSILFSPCLVSFLFQAILHFSGLRRFMCHISQMPFMSYLSLAIYQDTFLCFIFVNTFIPSLFYIFLFTLFQQLYSILSFTGRYAIAILLQSFLSFLFFNGLRSNRFYVFHFFFLFVYFLSAALRVSFMQSFLFSFQATPFPSFLFNVVLAVFDNSPCFSSYSIFFFRSHKCSIPFLSTIFFRPCFSFYVNSFYFLSNNILHHSYFGLMLHSMSFLCLRLFNILSKYFLWFIFISSFLISLSNIFHFLGYAISFFFLRFYVLSANTFYGLLFHSSFCRCFLSHPFCLPFFINHF